MKKILVIEPTASFRNFFTSLFADTGHRLVIAKDGKTALNQIQTDFFDLIITELFIPEMDGLEVIQEIRLRDPLTPIIATTVLQDSYREIYLRAARDLGASHAISKPFSDSDVSTIFTTYLAD